MKSRLVLFFFFAWRNVLRQKIRSLGTLSAIGLGVAALILAGGFVEDIYIQLADAVIHSQTGHIQLSKRGYREGRIRAPEKFLIDDATSLIKELSSYPEVSVVLPRLSFSGVLNNGKRDVGVIGEGVEPAVEAKLGTHLKFIEGRPLRDSDQYGIVLGQGLAQSLGLKAGDHVNLLMSLAQGAVNVLDFKVVGVFQSFSKEFDARAVRIPISAARTLMDHQGTHTIVLLLKDTEQTDSVVHRIQGRFGVMGYEVLSWLDLSDFYVKTKALYARQFGVLRLIILLMVLLSVANSVNMSMFERTREFGTLLALGDHPRTIFWQLLCESLVLGLIGVCIGVLLGVSIAAVISAIGIPMPPPPNANIGYTAHIQIVPFEILAASGIGLLATCLATILPARRASRLNVVDALRFGV